ncbi:MAG: GNAT family N-acetyltransferase [Nitrospinae bacterium]|nr:GNAT family N-acetyltransferase [Nitrospinota bacterium]
MSLHLLPPQPLTSDHQLDDFACGETDLDEWLKRRALVNQINGASRTFVVADADHHVFGYYSLASGAVARKTATGKVRRNMPEPIPVMVLGRLAVDRRVQGMQCGAALLKDAVERTMAVSKNVGVRALLVHALNDSARGFYQHFGFQESPIDRMTLMLRLEDAP